MQKLERAPRECHGVQRVEVGAAPSTQTFALIKIQEILEHDIETCGGLKDLVVHYIGDKAPAVEWAKEFFEPFLKREVRVIPVSPVVGLHVGPAVGISYICNKPLEGKITGDLSSLAVAN